MATIVLFHSMLGLRSVELRAADRLRAAGHEVITPRDSEGNMLGIAEVVRWPPHHRRAAERYARIGV